MTAVNINATVKRIVSRCIASMSIFQGMLIGLACTSS